MSGQEPSQTLGTLGIMGDVEPNDFSRRQLYSFEPSWPGALPDSEFDSLAVETGPTVHGEVFRGGKCQ